MTNVFEPFIQDKGFVILDGALATELEARGANLNHSLWSAKLLTENPGLIKQVHLDYLLAGADVITTASYQASFDGFEKNGYSKQQAIGLMRLSVQLAFEAREEVVKRASSKNKPIVAASVGPYGAALADGSEYVGHYGVSIEHLKNFHRERMKVLIATGADVLAFETIPCIDEAIALKEVMAEFNSISAWISFSCKNGTQISSGELFSDAIKTINDADNIIAVGVNCTSPEYIASLVSIGAKSTDKLIIVYPNKGEVYDPENKVWIPKNNIHTHYADDAKIWYQCGAKLIGGCCRTTPEDIKQLNQMHL
jgi:homocysteine S-methyltransferase